MTDYQKEQVGDGVRRDRDQRPAQRPRRNPEVAERYLAEMRSLFGIRPAPADGRCPECDGDGDPGCAHCGGSGRDPDQV